MANPTRLPLPALGLALAGTLAASPAFAAGPEGPGAEAIQLFRDGRPARQSVQNRFFLKNDRFEISPALGFVPNNPFAQRYVGGVGFGYHFSETFAAQFLLTYSPDLGTSDLKGLTSTLILIASSAGDEQFRQPLDKITLSGSAVAVWAPLYGKINLVGETVLNFDLYFLGGLTFHTKTDYFAFESDTPEAGLVDLEKLGTEPVFGPTLGVGFNFFLTQSVSLKLDGRFNFYIDNVPQYNPEEVIPGNRLYNNFVTSVGVSVFFPKMQERINDF
jgi:outer membrane beta-barrel protein